MKVEVRPGNDPLVRRTLKDFRLHADDARWVVHLKGEGKFPSAAFPELERGGQVLLEYIPYEDWRRPNALARWVTALRPSYLALSLFPLLLAAAARWRPELEFPWLNTALLFASILLVHGSCHFWGDYEDHLRGVDAPDRAGGSGVIQQLWIPAIHLRNAAALLFLFGAGLGAWLLSRLPVPLVGTHLLWLGALGAFGAAGYSGWPFHYKYLGFGEPIVFLLCGPVLTAASALVLFGDAGFLAGAALVSLPLAFLATLRLHGGNMQRIPFDTLAGASTIARWAGFGWSKAATAFLLAAPFLLVLALVAATISTPWSLTALLTAPLALWAFVPLYRAAGPLDPTLREFRERAVAFHWAFGLAYSLSFLA